MLTCICLSHVMIEYLDGITYIEKYDSLYILFYLVPPYWRNKQGYYVIFILK